MNYEYECSLVLNFSRQWLIWLAILSAKDMKQGCNFDHWLYFTIKATVGSLPFY